MNFCVNAELGKEILCSCAKWTVGFRKNDDLKEITFSTSNVRQKKNNHRTGLIIDLFKLTSLDSISVLAKVSCVVTASAILRETSDLFESSAFLGPTVKAVAVAAQRATAEKAKRPEENFIFDR